MIEQFEDTQNILSDLTNAFNSADKSETAFDNLGPSIHFNFTLFGISAPVLAVMGPALGLAVIYGGLHWFIERRHRDSWDAYLVRERDRLDRINQFLDHINIEQLDLENEETKNILGELKYLVEDYVQKTHDLALKIGYERVFTLKRETKEIVEANARILWLKRLLGEEGYKKYIELTDNVVAKKPDITKKVYAPKELKEQQKQLAETQNDPVNQFLGGAFFNILLSYGLAYWLVYYFAVEIFKLGASTPLSFGLLALTFPVIYLIYKEYSAYKARLLEKDIDQIIDEKDRETEQNRRDSQLHYRYGWILVAAILAVAVGGILNFATFDLGPTIILSAASFLTPLGIVKLVQDSIDRSVEEAQRKNNGKALTDSVELGRKELAEERCHQLDAMALNSYVLALQSKMNEERGKQSLFNKDENFDTRNYYATSFEISDVKKDLRINLDEESYEKIPPIIIQTSRRNITQILRLTLSVVLSAALGYALGNLIGFVAQDFLLNFTPMFSGMMGNLYIGAFSLIIGVLFGKRAYLTEKTHQNELEILHVEHQTQLQDLEKLNNELEASQNVLTILENQKKEHIALIREKSGDKILLAEIDELEKIKFEPFKHPVRHESITARKFLYGIRAILQILVAVATASLLVRAALKMGFAKLIPELAGGSLTLFGGTPTAFAFVVIGLIAAVLVLKIVNDLYLNAEKQAEKSAIEHVDFDIQVKEAELNYLEQQFDFTARVNDSLQSKLSAVDAELSDEDFSDSVLNRNEGQQVDLESFKHAAYGVKK